MIGSSPWPRLLPSGQAGFSFRRVQVRSSRPCSIGVADEVMARIRLRLEHRAIP
jgi:hypothetical protein